VPAGHSADELTPELLAYLGSADPYLRDEVAYPVLDTWITADSIPTRGAARCRRS
jgi:hypothetical protein